MNILQAEVAEQADALRSGRSGHLARVGSTPTFGIPYSCRKSFSPVLIQRGFLYLVGFQK